MHTLRLTWAGRSYERPEIVIRRCAGEGVGGEGTRAKMNVLAIAAVRGIALRVRPLAGTAPAGVSACYLRRLTRGTVTRSKVLGFVFFWFSFGS